MQHAACTYDVMGKAVRRMLDSESREWARPRSAAAIPASPANDTTHRDRETQRERERERERRERERERERDR
jgi:hypothetical protein